MVVLRSVKLAEQLIKLSDRFWIQQAIKHPGSLRAWAKREGAITERGTIDVNWLREKKRQLQEEAEGEKTLPKNKLRRLRQIVLALKLRQMPKRGRKKGS